MRALAPALAAVVVALGTVGVLLVFSSLRSRRPSERARGTSWARDLIEGVLARRGARRYADTPWTHYCHPDTEERVWRIGVERRTPDGRVLDPGRQEMDRLPLDVPEYERLVKVADAESRAKAFNLARVGM